MNKCEMYGYMCQIEKELNNLIISNRFHELIVAEIINESIIQLHELDSSSKSDEDTTKGIVTLNIESFYKPEHLAKVEDKYWNWDQRLQYGFKGRIMATPDSLIRFRNALDTTMPRVISEKMAMVYAVRRMNFNTTPKYNQKQKLITYKRNSMIVGVIILLIFLVSIPYTLSYRYKKLTGVCIMDTWTKELLIPDSNGKYAPRQVEK